jgi:hypothetical protein
VPGVEVGLQAAVDGAASVGKPGEEDSGLGDFLPGLVGLGAAQPTPLRFGSEASHPVPDGEVVQEPKVFGVLDGGEPFGRPALVEHELPVDAWSDAAVDPVVSGHVRVGPVPSGE